MKYAEKGQHNFWRLEDSNLRKRRAATEKISGFSDITKELPEVGLGEFRTFLRDNGGLGLSEMEFEHSEEMSALGALKNKKRKSAEASQILYALFVDWPVNILRKFLDFASSKPNGITCRGGS